MLRHVVGLLQKDNIFEDHETVTDIGNGIIFMTDGYTIFLIWSKNFVYLFDSHSRDRNGGFISDGISVALSFKSLYDVQGYIKTKYLIVTSRAEKKYDTDYLLNVFETFQFFQSSNRLKKSQICPHEKFKFYRFANYFIFGYRVPFGY